LVNLIKTIDPEEAYRKSCKSKSKGGRGTSRSILTRCIFDAVCDKVFTLAEAEGFVF
jgi:hypothetical protein